MTIFVVAEAAAVPPISDGDIAKTTSAITAKPPSNPQRE